MPVRVDDLTSQERNHLAAVIDQLAWFPLLGPHRRSPPDPVWRSRRGRDPGAGGAGRRRRSSAFLLRCLENTTDEHDPKTQSGNRGIEVNHVIPILGRILKDRLTVGQIEWYGCIHVRGRPRRSPAENSRTNSRPNGSSLIARRAVSCLECGGGERIRTFQCHTPRHDEAMRVVVDAAFWALCLGDQAA